MRAPYGALDRGQGVSILLCLLILTVLLCQIVITVGGAFSYSLDDPYIHLAVAEGILHGGYGVNNSEFSSPSSSIIFPVFISPLLLVGFGQYGPLFINIVCTIISIMTITKFIRGHDRLLPPDAWLAALPIVFVIAGTLNLFGVAFTGMEHSLHIATSLLVLYGLIRTMETGAMPGYLVGALILNPLVRFEGLALTAGALLALALTGRWRGAMCIGGIVLALVGGFMIGLTAMGLEPLPSSILVKAKSISATVDGKTMGVVLKRLFYSLRHAPDYTGGVIIIILGALLAFRFVATFRKLRYPLRDPETAVIVAALPAILGHLLLGQYGWMARYELYIVFISLFSVIYVFRVQIKDVFKTYTKIKLALFFILLIENTPAIWIGTWYAALASQSIYLQQYQMHRFAAELYRKPVTVNDLGWVSFRNPHYVLDVWGLGSERARKLREGSTNTDWMDRLAAEKSAELVMIYRRPGEVLPRSWTMLGMLSMNLPFMSTYDSRVYFFATDRADRYAVEQSLAEFEKTLPPDATFTRADKLRAAR